MKNTTFSILFLRKKEKLNKSVCMDIIKEESHRKYSLVFSS